MTAKSSQFEQRIERIHRLLEAEGSVITWDDRIPDPDNPSQSRQIDITIRRDGRLTIVECRIRREPQDVTWIEELIGRRVSLHADAAIAVSASGFTTGAEAKAARFGIILRHFETLTQDEIRNWGKERKVQLIFYEFTNTVITFRVPGPPTLPVLITDHEGQAVVWRGPFDEVMKRFDDEPSLDLEGAVGNLSADFHAPILVNGTSANSIKIEAQVRRFSREVSLASVVVYADPFDQTTEASVGLLDLGASEIVEAGDRVSVMVDLSLVEIPPNSLFHTILLDFGRVVEVRGFKFMGLPEAMAFQNSITLKFEAS